MVSLNQRGVVDPDYMANLTGMNVKDVVEALDGYASNRFALGGDPRGGSCLTIFFADGSSNRFDKEGWSI